MIRPSHPPSTPTRPSVNTSCLHVDNIKYLSTKVHLFSKLPLILLSMMLQVFIHSMDDMLIVDSLPQHLWTRRIAKIFFNSKQTYTTEGARQLTIKQRKCVFPDEISLLTDSNYTFSACMIQCRMDMSRKLCGCVSWFYKSIGKCKLTFFK